MWTILAARQATAKAWGLTGAMSSPNIPGQSVNSGRISVVTALIFCGNSATKWARNAAAFSRVTRYPLHCPVVRESLEPGGLTMAL